MAQEVIWQGSSSFASGDTPWGLYDSDTEFISSAATKAAYSMYEVMHSPTDLGNKEKMVAAKDVLDRSGFTKTDKVEVTAASPLFILPPKNDEND